MDTSIITGKKQGLKQLGLGILGAGLILTANAQESTTTEQESELRDMVVTASRMEEPSLDVPANTTIITAGDIADTTATSVPEVLQDLAGVEVSSWLGTGRSTSVDIRGFGETAGANTLVLVDGRRINSPTLSGVDWSTVPLERIKRIEVIRGGASVMYGDNATGGVVNIITKKGATEHTLDTDTTVGSYDYFKQSLTLSGNLDQDWFYNFNGSYTDTDGYRDNGYFRNKTTGLRLGYDPDSLFSIDLSAGIKNDSYGLPGSIPEGDDPESTNAPNDFAETQEYYAQVTPQIEFSDGSKLSLGLKLRNSEQYSEWKSMMSVNEFKLYEWGISPQYTFDISNWGIDHRITLGVDYYSSDMHEIKSYLPPLDRHRHEAGYYVNDKITLLPSKLYLDAGYRRARVNYDFSDGKHDAFDIDAANLGLTYRYADKSKLFASFDRSYRTMRLDELGGLLARGKLLPPQITNHYQAGIQHHFNDKLTVSTTIFEINTDDEIFFDPKTYTNKNYQETCRRGIELEIEANPHEKVEIFANYTWMRPELGRGSYEGNEIPGVSRNSGSIGLKMYPMKNMTIDTRARWADGKNLISDWNNNLGEEWNDDYVVWDMLISYDISSFTIYAGVNNILDEEYAEYGSYYAGKANIYPSPDRNFITGIRFTKTF